MQEFGPEQRPAQEGQGARAVNRGAMETLREALARLERRGFRSAFRAMSDGTLELDGETAIAPEALVVEETVRFEGESDPEDQAVLFALRSRDGRIRGTFIAAYGPQIEPACAAVVHRLPPEPGREQVTQARP